MPFALKPASDHSLLISFGNEISPAHHRQVYALTQRLLTHPASFICNLHPAYCSLLIAFDPLLSSLQEVEAYIRKVSDELAEAVLPAPRRVEIPVCYEEEFGIDLQDVAAHHHLTREEVIRLHASGEYRVYFLGFTPGFAYLGGLSPRLYTPRLLAPRTQVPAGSVAIGGQQTGIYPMSTPGGWRIIGRTPLKLFASEKESPALLALGDEVRFAPISPREFEELSV
ncbi:5-oxoprolinase subunit PxpB [candidate division KSB1 bacterium]|nr:5-oxoprolinase subunit PxpB [candidate division KSB1 bacterium]